MAKMRVPSMKPLTAKQKQEKAYAEMETKLKGRRRKPKPPIKLPTSGEITGKRTGSWARNLPIVGPGIAALQDALTPKKKKED